MVNSHQKLGQFVGRGFQSRTDAHLFHLTTDSYAAHIALGAYYEGVIALVDGVAETYQGLYGVVPLAILRRGCGQQGDAPSTAVEALKDYLQWIEANRKDISDRSVIQNQIDTVVELLASTIYKLENLS